MFFKKEERKKRGFSLPLLIARMLLSFTMLAVFGIGIYQAVKYFTGSDPLKFDPKVAVLSIVTSQDSAGIIKGLFSLKFPPSSQDLTQALKDPKAYLGNLKSTASQKTENQVVAPGNPTVVPSGPVVLKFGLVADSHIDNVHLKKALSQIKGQGAKFVIGLGDYSEVGTVEELDKAKEAFVSSGLPFYVTSGDHDLWDSRNKKVQALTNFDQIFGSPYQSFGDSNIRFIIVDNSDDYLGIDNTQMSWLQGELDRLKETKPRQAFVFMHEPLYHPTSDHYMGKVTGSLDSQVQKVESLLTEAAVGGVFFGDAHFFSQYKEPKTGIPMAVVGAVTEDRNTQKPRFAIVDVFEGGAYNIEDVEIQQ